jgi:hypothetical protein
MRFESTVNLDLLKEHFRSSSVRDNQLLMAIGSHPSWRPILNDCLHPAQDVTGPETGRSDYDVMNTAENTLSSLDEAIFSPTRE